MSSLTALHMIVDARTYALDAILKDGGSIHIRALHPTDRERLIEHFEKLSPQSVYFRFFRSKKRLTPEELQQFTELDFKNRVALIATLLHSGAEQIIGVGRFSTLEESHRAEVAFAVIDGHQNRGIGTLLLEHLAIIARFHGITEFEADVLGENNQMLRVFSKSGFKVRRSLEAGVFHVTFPTEETTAFISAHHRRERSAAALSIRPILNPKSVAVVGASVKQGTIGAALIDNIVRCGFTGAIYPVNPSSKTIAGLRCYKSVREIGAPVDLAIIAVPAKFVEETITDCATSGVRGLVVISSGFGEVSEEGREAEKRIRDLVRASGMRMVGPNCLGVLNTDPEISLNGTFAPPWPPTGNVGMLSQSGALGLAILDRARDFNIGMSTFVSVGNKADISANDLLAYWNEDPRTKVILLYLESFGNPRKFSSVAPEVARRKPIVAVKSGRTTAGTRAASSHSAALASLDVHVDALFEQAGVIRTDTLEGLLDLAAFFSTQPVPLGPRVGVVTNAGGPGILLADACEGRGLRLPELHEDSVKQLRSYLPRLASVANPVDMIASASPEDYARTIEIVGQDPNIDNLVVIYLPPITTSPEEIASAIARGTGTVPPEKPVLSVFMSSLGVPPVLGSGPRGSLPSYSFPENAAMALAAAERYGRWRKRETGKVITLKPFARAAVRAVVDRVLSTSQGNVWMSQDDIATILHAAGISFASTECCSVETAVATAERMGYPLVAKIVSAKVLHKSDIGGVMVGLKSATEVEQAIATLSERMEALAYPLEGIILQREISQGVEAFVGVTTDPTFGPLVVCGLGGVYVEILKDVSFRLHPVSDQDAQEMIDALRSGRLLDGYRGAPPGDRAALVDVIQRISALVEIVPELRELDLNPVKVLPPGRGAIAVDGRIRIGPLKPL